MLRFDPIGAMAHRVVAVGFACLVGVAHADLTVPAGGSYDLAGGSTDLGCTDVIVGGTLSLSGGTLTNVRNVIIAAGGVINAAGSITLSGDWSNAGTFNAATGSVSFVDAAGCATTGTVTGNTNFYKLSMVTSSGKLYRFAAGSSQRVGGTLTMVGYGAPIRIESTVSGTFANIDATILQNMANLAVRDMSANGEWIAQGLTNQAAGAQVYRWFGFPSVPVNSPALLIGIVLLLLLFGRSALNKHRRARH